VWFRGFFNHYIQNYCYTIWEVQNFSASKLETVLHHPFEKNRLVLDIPTINGKASNPTEWFVLSFDEIESTINQILLDIQI
jgi:hypothetical protein